MTLPGCRLQPGRLALYDDTVSPYTPSRDQTEKCYNLALPFQLRRLVVGEVADRPNAVAEPRRTERLAKEPCPTIEMSLKKQLITAPPPSSRSHRTMLPPRRMPALLTSVIRLT